MTMSKAVIASLTVLLTTTNAQGETPRPDVFVIRGDDIGLRSNGPFITMSGDRDRDSRD